MNFQFLWQLWHTPCNTTDKRSTSMLMDFSFFRQEFQTVCNAEDLRGLLCVKILLFFYQFNWLISIITKGKQDRKNKETKHRQCKARKRQEEEQEK